MVEETHEETSQEAMKGFSFRSTLAAKAAPEVPDKPLHGQPAKPQLQQTTVQQQQRTAEMKELRAKAAAAKKELAETPWVNHEKTWPSCRSLSRTG